MSKELEDLLLTYLGELMHKRDSKFDWVERDIIVKKINAVNILLEIDAQEQTTMQKMREFFKNNPV